MKNIIEFITEAKSKYDWKRIFNDKYVYTPFKSKEELMEFTNEVETQKRIIKKYDDEAQKIWNQMTKAEAQLEKEFRKTPEYKGSTEDWNNKYKELKDKYQIDTLMQQATEVTKTPECVAANEKLYGELQQRALNSLTKAEAKKCQVRGGFMYNLLIEVYKKYMNWDFRTNKPIKP